MLFLLRTMMIVLISINTFAAPRRIIYIRHGHAEHNQYIEKGDWGQVHKLRDPSLTEKGKEQASKLAEKLYHEKIDIVLTSPMRRALETTHTVFNDRNLAIEPIQAITEYGGTGTWDWGSPKSVLSGLFPSTDFGSLSEDWWLSTQNETWDNLRKRVQSFKEHLSQRTEHTIVVVSHGTFLSQLLQLKSGDSMKNCELREQIIDQQ